MGFLSRLRHAGRWARAGFRMGAALHEAADTTGRLSTWTATGADINTILGSSGNELVRRSRALVGANGYARAARRSFVGNLIGTGIKPASGVEEVDQLWKAWCSQADADRQSRFYGVQTILAKSLFDAGEMFVRLRSRREGDGLRVPLQLQMLEAEYLDRTYTLALPNGNQVKSGIEFNRIVRRVAYHFFRQHPGDGLSVVQDPTRTRVPAKDVLHIYEVERPGQIRGMPKSVAALVKLHQLDKYDAGGGRGGLRGVLPMTPALGQPLRGGASGPKNSTWVSGCTPIVPPGRFGHEKKVAKGLPSPFATPCRPVC